MIFLFKSISKSFELYANRPAAFVFSTLTHCVFNLLLLLALAGVFLIFFFIVSVFKLAEAPTVFAIVGAILALFYLYFSSAFFGSLVKAYSLLATGTNFSFMDFYRYAMGNGWTFFSLNLIRLVLLALVNLPSALIYFLYLSQNPIKYVDYLLLLLSIFLTFFVELFLFPSFIAAATYNSGVLRSLKFAGQLFQKRHIFAVCLFVVYSFVWVFNWVPVIQLVTILVFYPVVYTAMIVFFQTYCGKGK